MTSPDQERPPVVRIAGGAKSTGGKVSSGPKVDPDYVRLLQILDRHPEAKRQVIEALSRKG